MKEQSRQTVHLAGILFVILAQFTGGLAAGISFLFIAGTFLLLSLHLRAERRRLSLLERIGKQALTLERPGMRFHGAFWLYLGCGLAFLLFPFPVATSSSLIVLVADALATLVGHGRSRWKITENSSLEGSMTLFIAALAIAWFFASPAGALLAAVAAMLGDIIPDLAPRLRKRGLVDDNIIIPLVTGFVILMSQQAI